MWRSKTILTVLVLAVGCAVPAEIKDKIATEAAIHAGYARFVDVAPIESLRAIVRQSGAAWSALDAAVNQE